MSTLSQRGFTVIELLFVAALMVTLAGLSIPMLDRAADDLHTATAARYLAGRIHGARLEAVKRGAAVALRFEASAPDYVFTQVVDGNGNGVRTADVATGVDEAVGPSERLGSRFRSVRLGLLPGVPQADGSMSPSTDGVRIGAARILTLSPDGTATSGTLYLHGRWAQYAVRVLGVTARTRVLEYRRGAGTWISR